MNTTKKGLLAKKKILIVDDHPMMRSGMAQLINAEADLQVCFQAGSSAEALKELAKYLPDLVVTDLTMAGRGGLELIKDARTVYPDLKMLVISMHDETLYAERALRAGARGYLMKEAGGEAMLAAIRQIIAGQVYVSPAISARILENLSSPKSRGSSSPVEKLSDREFEVFRHIGLGKTIKEIAKELNLSPKTVDVHRSKIKEKLELQDITAVVRHAVRWAETEGGTQG